MWSNSLANSGVGVYWIFCSCLFQSSVFSSMAMTHLVSLYLYCAIHFMFLNSSLSPLGTAVVARGG